MNKRPIYLDYMATTPLDPRVLEAMLPCLVSDGVFGNAASSSHVYGWQAEELIATAREQVANAVGVTSREIVFTSGATEANNLAIKGVAEFYQNNGRHIITMSTEHKAVLDPLKELEARGFDVTYLDPEPDGLLDVKKLEQAIRPDTILISIMLVNNETGVIQDLKAIGDIAKAHGVLLHSDAAQAVGKVALNVHALPVDLMSFSAHKAYGPKGIGALYVRRKPRVHLKAQLHGGGHEFGLRSGTLPTHQIVGMGRAFDIVNNDFEQDHERMQALTQKLWQGIKDLPDVFLNGSQSARVVNNLNVCFDGVDGEALMLSLKELAISSGSACNSATLQPSHVLKAMGLSSFQASSSLRLCVGRMTTEHDIDMAISAINNEVERLRAIAPEDS